MPEAKRQSLPLNLKVASSGSLTGHAPADHASGSRLSVPLSFGDESSFSGRVQANKLDNLTPRTVAGNTR